MKIDITSLCFGFKIEKDNDSGTAAWATSIGQAPKDICYIDTNREGLDEIVYGMMYKSHSDFENLKVRDVIGLDKREEPRGDRERMMFSVFEDVYVNNMKVDGIYTLTYEREDTPSHKNRLHICYAKYLTYNGHTNKATLKEMAKKLGCSEDACWFVTDITIRNQKCLHFTAIVVNPEHLMIYQNSKERKRAWDALIPEVDYSFNNHQMAAPLQQIFYGAPGTGKSHKIKENEQVKNAEEKKLVFRTTFHPDSDYSTFVGAYKPTMKKQYRYDGKVKAKYYEDDDLADAKKDDIIIDKVIQYDFVPQTFTNAYVAAWKNQDEKVFLIIEEINRGNCAQIFGDLFQLLDRDENGVSEYKIKADADIRTYIEDVLGKDSDGIKDGELCLPKNLYIWATMNTSDQSLFPIDSAFKRRWDWEYEPIKYSNKEWVIEIGNNKYSWTSFQKKVNDRIFRDFSSEDKMLGDYFVNPRDGIISKELLLNKILFYLWNDVCKDGDGDIFKTEDDKEVKFSELYGEEGTEKLLSMMKHLKVELLDESKAIE